MPQPLGARPAILIGFNANGGSIMLRPLAMHLLLCANDSEPEFLAEMRQDLPGSTCRRVRDLLLEADLQAGRNELPPRLVFLRQCLLEAVHCRSESIRGWAKTVAEQVISKVPESHPWQLQIAAHYGAHRTHRIGARAWHTARRDPRARVNVAKQENPVMASNAGQNRASLIAASFHELLREKRRHLLKTLHTDPTPFTPQTSLVQLMLTTPDEGYLSISLAPQPFEQRHLVSPFPKGELPVSADPLAPSRAFSKLVEAEQRLGRCIAEGETCVDLGAAPGSWTYVAAGRGARVIAVDRARLREDLMRNPAVQVIPGDAFKFAPAQGEVDWLLCDVIAPAETSAELLLRWLTRKQCRRFVVTLKTRDTGEFPTLARLKKELQALTKEFYLTRLCANKKEVTAFGTRLDD